MSSDPPFEDSRKEFLFIFVHGFLGTVEGFSSFPTDILNYIALRSQSTKKYTTGPISRDQLDVKMYPTYDTKGSFYGVVQKFTDWLFIEASTLQYKNVILCGHSMGGLVIADAYARLYKVHEESALSSNDLGTVSTTEQDASWLAWTKQKLRNTFSYSTYLDPNAPKPSDMRILVNVVGIITFDTPFYGLHNRVVTLTGASKAQELLSEELPKIQKLGLESFVPEKIIVEPVSDLRVPISTKWVKDRIMPASPSNEPSEDTKADVNEIQGEIQDMVTNSHWSEWVRHAAVGGLVAATAFYTLSLTSASVMSIAINKALQHSPDLSQFQDFLTPLYESFGMKHARVQLLATEVTEHKRVYFHALYLILVPAESTSETNRNTTTPRHFCVPPPEDVSQFFSLIPSALSDEIDAHMNIFDQSRHGDKVYIGLLDRMADLFGDVLESME